MGGHVPYTVEFAQTVERHFRVLTAGERTTVLDAIGRQLLHEPLKETRHRKPLRPNPIAPWELRVKNLRVFYDVSEGARNVVNVLAIGIKRGNTIVIEGEEIEL